MPSESLVNGYYGKVSTHGDFVNRGLPTSFINPWDAWMQEAVFNSCQQLGDNWLNCYLTGPIYRFALAPGICGKNAWLGVMMPSVDSIGRYYPMTIATINRQNANPFLVMQKEEDWFAKVEALALSTLADGFNLAQFNGEIDALFFDRDDETQVPSERVAKQKNHNAWQKTIKGNQSVIDVIPALFNDLLREQYFAYSLWWTQGSELVKPSLLVCQGMPPFDGIAAMLDGDWQKWGWEGNYYPFGEQNKNAASE